MNNSQLLTDADKRKARRIAREVLNTAYPERWTLDGLDAQLLALALLEAEREDS
jgi:hypothetical protein